MIDEHFKRFVAIPWIPSFALLLQRKKKTHVVWVDLKHCLKEDEEGLCGGRDVVFGYGSSVVLPRCGLWENSCHSVWLKQICLLAPFLFPQHHKHRPHPPRISSIFSYHPLPPSTWLLFHLKRSVAIHLLTSCQLLWWQHVALSKSNCLPSFASSSASWHLGFNVLFIFAWHNCNAVVIRVLVAFREKDDL